MLGRVLRFLFIALLAWNFGGSAMWFLERFIPVVGAVLGSLVPSDFAAQDARFYFNVVIGMVFFWVIVKLTGLSFSFMLPHGQRFGTTKLVRRIQGAVAEVILFAVIFGAGFAFLALTPPGADMVAEALVNRFAQGFGPGWENDIQGVTFVRGSFRTLVYESIYNDRNENQRRGAPGEQRTHGLQLVLVSMWKPLLIMSLVVYGLLQWVLFKTPGEAIYRHLLRFFEIGRFGIGGSGRFAGLIEEWAHRWKRGDKALFVGRSLYNRFLDLGLKDDRHMLTIAGSRTGKGATVIIPNLLSWPGSVVVIDPKGTNAAVTWKHRADRLDQHVFLIDPFSTWSPKGDELSGFNPLAQLDPHSRTIREEIAVIADALVVPDPAAKDQHWEDGARTIIAGLIGQLISDPQYRKNGPPTLPMIRDLLALGAKEQAELWVNMKYNEAAGGVARDAAARVIRGAKTDEITNIISNADKHTEWLSSPAMKKSLSHDHFKFSLLKEKKVSVYLVIPPRFLEVHRRFLRLFVNLTILQMSEGGKSKIPVLMVLDEFLSLGKMVEVERAFRLMAGYNFTIWPFVQDYGGLEEMYGKSVNAFVTNSRAVQVFAVDDTSTLKFVSEHLGERSLEWVRSVDKSLRSTPLRTPKEISIEVNKEHNLQYILRTGRAPLVAEKVRYFEGGDVVHTLPGPLSRFAFPFAGLFGRDPDY